MSFEVKKLSKNEAKIVVENKHYSGRLGIFWEAFGLFYMEKLIGVCCYGQPSAPIQKHAFADRNFRLYELTRLVIDDKAPKNSASYLISHSLQMLKERPCAVVSYADSAWNHCGIVYQASNWIYTGFTKSHDYLYIVNGIKTHPMTLRDKYGVTNPVEWAKENNIEKVRPQIKYRYFYLVGTAKQKKYMLKRLKYKVVVEYPKTEKSKYQSDIGCQFLLEKLYQ